jgi:hypothetical protein
MYAIFAELLDVGLILKEHFQDIFSQFFVFFKSASREKPFALVMKHTGWS